MEKQWSGHARIDFMTFRRFGIVHGQWFSTNTYACIKVASSRSLWLGLVAEIANTFSWLPVLELATQPARNRDTPHVRAIIKNERFIALSYPLHE